MVTLTLVKSHLDILMHSVIIEIFSSTMIYSKFVHPTPKIFRVIILTDTQTLDRHVGACRDGSREYVYEGVKPSRPAPMRAVDPGSQLEA